ncbi:HTH-type transcriptional activator RhaS [Sinobacterium norvegicum]|uniref:HTH-type transcriptional activator RhaS n=1 Tax=Sinobacterium norvegicum TaxID=1641715 RepID=A0ABN8EPY9_9GAMM|nr:AraC family transcriptional regulator [Sinobacterium norvegicum]CAH0993053.1 HTH-type transcriptional activator RhaS [Sinobacterium norvegicum]
MDWLTVALIAAMSQGILLCFMIVTLNFGNRKASPLLALLVGLNTIPMALYTLSKADISLPPLFYIALLFLALKGPVLFLYVRALTEADFHLQRNQWLHSLALLPAAVVFILLYLQSGSENTNLIGFFGQQQLPIFNILVNSVILVYAVFSLLKLEEHNKKIEQSFSLVDSRNLSWLRGLIVFIIIVAAFHFGLDLAYIAGLVTVEPKSYLVLFMNFGVILFIAIGGMRQPVIFTDTVRGVMADSESKKTNDEAGIEAKKYAKSAMDESVLSELWRQLEQLMTEQKPFLSDDLTLPQLAESMALSPHDLSQLINTQSGANFYELINRYRIEAAKQLLSDADQRQRKMTDIAESVGFKSQSSFYNQFKKYCQMTPRQFKQATEKTTP